MTVPDSLQGALVLSFVDLALSFILIGGIGVILSLFPYINKLGTIDERKLGDGH